MWKEKSDLHQVELLSSLKDELEIMDKLEFPMQSSCCIYRVPPRLGKVNEAAYTPVSVSIGPYHHGNKGLESMEEVKLWFLYKFLERTKDKSVNGYVHLLKGQEGKIRRCYSETIPMESDEFLRMILTDACFIIEYFLLWLDENRWHSNLSLMWDITTPDLILLENQLPFFVLKDLFNLAFPDGYNDLTIEVVTFSYVSQELMQVPNDKLREKFTFLYFVQHHLPTLPDGTPQVHHLCDMLRICYVPLDQQLPRERNLRKLKHLYSACKLHDAGIKFEVSADEISLFKLQYSKGVLKIPEGRICDITEASLRNVVAFERYHFPRSRSMTDYIILMEYLIRTEKDVEILFAKGIIRNIIGENDAAAFMTKRLGSNTQHQYFNEDYISLVEHLNNFCDDPYQKYKAIFKQQYWSSPWRIASFLGAILLMLFLTLVQTICSVIAVFEK